MYKMGWKDVPKCTKRKNHDWKKGAEIYNESLICGLCGYDVCEQRYREIIQ
jgi:hypothetical protein